MMLELEDVVVRFDLLAGLLRGESGLASFLLAHKGGATSSLGDPDASHSRLLRSPPDVG